MTSIIKLEALSGAQDDGPLCYLLTVDDSYILLDAGWNDSFDEVYIDAVRKRVPYINAVLLSYADPAHLGALPYLVAKAGLTAPIYATVPVYKMGQMFMYDWVYAHQAVEDFAHFSLDDVDSAFERVQQVKYHQTVALKGDIGLQVTALPAGHMIGGAIWKISKTGDDEIVYAVDFNHKKERHLNGCLFDAIQRPHLLITDAYNATYKQPGRKQRDEKLVKSMMGTLKRGGDVLVVIDTAGRVLEIAHLLDQLWGNAEAGLASYQLVMLSHVASSVVEFAKSQVEWMADKILKSFETGRNNPFQFRHVQLVHSHAELQRVRSPKVVLCPDLSMEIGFARELFLEMAADTRNTIIITGRSGDRTLGSKLIHLAEGTSRASSRLMKLEVKRRVKLEGTELEEYRVRKRAEDQEKARIKLEAQRRSARIGRADDSDSESDDEEAIASAVAAVTGLAVTPKSGGVNGTPGGIASTTRSSSIGGALATPGGEAKAAPVGSTTSISGTAAELHTSAHDILIRWEQQQRASFFKQNKRSFPMFGYTEEKAKWDDYGEIIRPEDYMIDVVLPVATTQQVKQEPIWRGQQLMKSEDPVDEETPSTSVPEEIPTKCIKYKMNMEVMCQVEFIEFEGRSDGESIKKILSQIKPKQLIIVHGSRSSTQHLASYALESGAVQGKIHTPMLGQVVDCTVESHIFQVTLSDALLSSLLFQNVKEAELVWLDARLKKRIREDSKEEEEKDEGVDVEEADDEEMDQDGAPIAKRMKSRKQADKFVLDLLPSTAVPSHHAVFVNEPKLSDLKAMLVTEGFQAEFSSGVLFINGVASIRRNEAGRFHVEGCASEQYYKIRDLIYNQFAIV